MERHFSYLSTSGLIAEAGRDANQTSNAIGHRKIVRHIGLVLYRDHQAKDSLPAHVEEKCDWDDPVNQRIPAVWQRWRSELRVLRKREIQRRYFPKDFDVESIELHGFCDASQSA